MPRARSRRLSDDWDVCGRKAEAFRARRRWKEALSWFNKALKRNPCDTVSRDAYLSDLAGKVDCLVRLRRFAEAERVLGALKRCWHQ